jgi:hypothetical protein
MSINMINYAVKKAVKGGIEKPKLFKSTVVADKETVFSSLSGESKLSNTSSLSPNESPNEPGNSNEATSALLMLKSGSTSDPSTTESKSSTNDAMPSIQDFIDSTIHKNDMTKSIGRPKGTTVAASLGLKEKIEVATKEATEWLANNMKSQRSHKKRAEKGLLKEVIEAAKQKHGVPDNVVIPVATVRQRVKRKSKWTQRAKNTHACGGALPCRANQETC